MQIFISSLIAGFEAYRNSASGAIETLGHQPVRAEDFPASPESPQRACLAGVRASDAVVLILGERYGVVQQSGLSATHEEYREARESRPVLVFIVRGGPPEPRQQAFIDEVRGWERGHYTADVADDVDLRDRVTRALHDFILTDESAPLDEGDLLRRAESLIPNHTQGSNASLIVAIAPGPIRAMLRPAQLDSRELRQFLLAESLTGDCAVLTPSTGTDVETRGDTIRLLQQGGGSVTLDESGGLVISQQLVDASGWRNGIPSILEEDVVASLERAWRFASRCFDHIDPAGRVSHAALVVAVSSHGFLPWRTREEQMRSPNQASMPPSSRDQVVVWLTPAVRRRPALIHEASQLAEDFTVRLRREIRQ